MARSKSDLKRHALLAAATLVVAQGGLAAPTSAVSRAAGVAEGTLFAYFPTKDHLLNALYCQLKQELATVMMADFPRQKSVRDRLRHVWNRYVEWGVSHSEAQKVLSLLIIWDGLTPESIELGSAPFAAIVRMAEEAVAQRIVRPLPQDFIAALMQSLAETTMGFIRRSPKQSSHFRDLGFESLWAAIAQPA